jgi:hypothetical protein
VTIEARSHLIRLPGGRVRVLRLVAGATTYALHYDVHPDEDMCLRCGCTDIFGCVGGCSWANAAHTICTRCVERSMLL